MVSLGDVCPYVSFIFELRVEYWDLLFWSVFWTSVQEVNQLINQLYTLVQKKMCVCISASPCHLESPIILLSWVPYDLITVCINMQKCIICFCSSCVGRQFESPHMSHSTYTTGFNELILNTSSVHSRLEFLPIAQKNWLLSKHQIFMLISGVKMASEPPVTNVTAAVLWGVEMWVSSL